MRHKRRRRGFEVGESGRGWWQVVRVVRVVRVVWVVLVWVGLHFLKSTYCLDREEWWEWWVLVVVWRRSLK